MELLLCLAAVLIGLMAGWLFWGRGLAAARSERERMGVELGVARSRLERLDRAERDLAQLGAERAGLAEELAAMRRGAAERERALAEQAQLLDERFRVLADAALRQSRDDFMRQADEAFRRHREGADAGLTALLTPVAETLKRYEEGLKAVETARTEAYGGLAAQVEALRRGQSEVRQETAKLVSALRSSPKARGRWGEQQLRNVLELAGLSPHCDFRCEVSVEGEDGRLRPDVVVRLPGGRSLIVDAKCALNDYLDASEALDEAGRQLRLKAHAAALRTHAEQLSRKAYWDQFEDSPDFVIMFVPGEHFLAAALEQDPQLWEWAFEKRVLMTAPTHLVAIAKTVASVWRQEKVAAEAREIAELGRELYQRLATMGEHVARLGRSLGAAVGSYNDFVGSLEAKVLPGARRFVQLNVEPGKKTLDELSSVEAVPREVRARELAPSAGPARIAEAVE
jgi:DNA recombination protein RmuC